MPYIPEHYPADIHATSAELAADMNDVVRAIGGPEADQHARFMDAVEKTRQEIPDAYEQQLLTMSADAHCWYLWGKHGQPLPRGLRLRTSPDGYGPAVDYRFPYSADIEERILEKLGPNGAYEVIGEIDTNRGERYQSDLSPSLLRYTQAQVGLKTLYSITHSVQRGEREATLSEEAAIRHQVHKEYGIDVHDSKTGIVYPQHDTPYFDTPRWTSAQSTYHRRAFMGGSETRPQDLEGNLLSTVRQGFETWVTSNTADPNATTVIAQAQEAAATSTHSDAEQSLADLLGNIFDAKQTTPAMPGAREVFIRLGSELLTKNQFMTPDAYGNLTVPATWDQLLDQSLFRLSRSGPGFVGGALNIRHYNNDRRFLATLRQPQAPLEAYKVESGMVEVPLPTISKPQLRTPLRYAPGSVTFEPHDYVEAQKNVTVGNVHVLRPAQIPATPRIIFEDPHYSTEALEKHRDMPHDNADVVLVFEKETLANNATPSMKGFELISIVGDGAGSEQYYFQYVPKKDPYQASSRALGSYIAGNIAKQLYDIGLDDMGRAVHEQADTLSPHSLANIVKAYSIASYPLGEEGKPHHALIAQVQSIDDLKQFAVGKLFIGQASSTTTLLNYLLPYSSFPTSKIEGYLWRPGESTIDATRHQHLAYGQYNNSTHSSVVLDVEPTLTPDLEIIDPPRNSLHRPEIVRQESTGNDIDLEDTSTERVNLSSKEIFWEKIRQTYGTLIMLNKRETTNRARLLGAASAQPRATTEDEHADLAVFMEHPVADTKEPVLYGYTLTAFDREQKRAYFRYDASEDYYENDFPIETERVSVLADGARKAGLFKLGQALQDISQDFSIRQLEKLIGTYTEYTFPDVAQDETEFYTITSLQDFCSFITNEGMLGVQCTSTAQFSKLLLQYVYPDMEIEALSGYLTPPISGRIKNISHRTLLCKPKGGKPFIFDPSPQISDDILAEISNPQPAHTETPFAHRPSQAAEDDIFDVANSFHNETTASNDKEPKRHFQNGRQALLERAKDHFESLDESDIIVAIELAKQALFARELNVGAAEAHAEKSTTEFDATNSILRSIAGDFQSPQHQHRQQYWATETTNHLQRRAQSLGMRDRLRVNEATSVLRLMRLAALQEQEKNS